MPVPDPTDGRHAAGVDGCRGGWIAAIACGPPDAPAARTELHRLTTGDVAALADRGVTVALDMPMGLPAHAGLRACDRLARERLGHRRSSIFPALDRELLGLDFAAARAVVLARRRATAGLANAHPVMTHQAINLGPKIAALDAILRERPQRQRWLVESHPELSFSALAPACGAGAELPPKRTAAGRAARLALLREPFPDAKARIAGAAFPRGEVAPDDVLDAYAVLWSALRHRGGRAETLGGERDALGLVQRIVV